MTEILILLLINSLFCIGLHVATRYNFENRWYNANGEYVDDDHLPHQSNMKGKLPYDTYEQVFESNGSMALGYLGYLVESLLPEWMSKPLLSCVSCMASFWGSAFLFAYWASMGCPERVVWIIGMPVYIFALCGLNTFIANQMEL